MNIDTVMTFRKEQIRRILTDRRLSAALFCNAIRENWDSWLLGSTEIPILQPFGRLNLFLATAEGQVHCLCAYANHPCDFPHYPLFDCTQFDEIFSSGKIGIVNPECLLKLTRDQLSEHYPALQYEDVTADFLAAKARRCPEEAEGVRRAAQIYDRAFVLMPWLLRPEQTEAQIAVELRSRLGTLGAEVIELSEDPNASILVTLTSALDGGESVPEPLMYPGRRLQVGDRVNVGVNGYLAGGFAAALGRCYVLGRASDETKRCWDMTLQAQHMAAELLRPGTTIASAVKQVTDGLLEKNGFSSMGENCIYGIGCSRSEAPRFVDASRDMPLEEGMTLVIAPKLTLPGKDPYCCVDMFRVTEHGCERLSKTKQELAELF